MQCCLVGDCLWQERYLHPCGVVKNAKSFRRKTRKEMSTPLGITTGASVPRSSPGLRSSVKEYLVLASEGRHTSSGSLQPSHLTRPEAPVSPIWKHWPSDVRTTVRLSPVSTCCTAPSLQGPYTLHGMGTQSAQGNNKGQWRAATKGSRGQQQRAAEGNNKVQQKASAKGTGKGRRRSTAARGSNRWQWQQMAMPSNLSMLSEQSDVRPRMCLDSPSAFTLYCTRYTSLPCKPATSSNQALQKAWLCS